MDKVNFGTFLRQARLAAGLSREGLAESSGVSVRAINYIESGRTRKPHHRTVQALACVLSLEGAGREVPAAGDSRAAGSGPVAASAPPGQAGGLSSRDPRADGAIAPARFASLFPVPAQLPHDVPGFAGREAELAEMTKLLEQHAPAPRLLAIDGSPGTGKTALAIHWAHQAAGKFPDGQLYLDLQGPARPASPVTPAAAIRELLGAFGMPPERIPAGFQAQAGLYRSLLAGSRTLIVLDSALDEDQVRPLLPGGPGCAVVVTSRAQLVGLIAADGACPVTLNLLSGAEAHDMLARRLGADRLAAEPQATAELIRLCSRLPLALAAAAARATACPALTLKDITAGLHAAARH
jgi:transcriptional regulator with XRE-family HTH domain